MALPHTVITPIPDTQPDAIPSLWNTRYVEIGENFSNHENRVVAAEGEISAGRGAAASLDARFDAVELGLSTIDPDSINNMQNAMAGAIMQALDLAGIANRELQKTLTFRFQTGVGTIYNRGVISGCTVSKSADTPRTLVLAQGVFFMHGRTYSTSGMTSSELLASVPPNNGAGSADCYAYLYLDGNGRLQFDATQIGGVVPENGLCLYRITVPAGNTEVTDPYIVNCTLIDQRRMEPLYPDVVSNPVLVPVAIPVSMVDGDTDYMVDLEVLSFEGSRFQLGDVYWQDKLVNGFKIFLNGTADKISVKCCLRKL